MRRILFLLSLLCIFTLAANAQKREYQTVQGDPMATRIYTLQNGLKVYLSVNKEKPRIAAQIAVNTGHKNDPAETTGLAHYLEHLMFKGTKQFGTSNYEAEKPHLDKITALYEEYRQITDPDLRKAKYHEIDSISQVAARYNIPNEYDKLMAAIGSEGSNAYTWYDITCYKEDVPSNEFENWAKIQSDRFQNLVIRGFHTELESVYEEKNMSLADDGEKAIDALMNKLFPSHSYGTQTTIGTQDHLKNPSIVNILNYYNKYYKPNNIAICLVGDLDPDETMNVIEKYFGSWQAGNDIAHRQFPAQPVYTAPVDTAVVGIEQESIMLGWRFKGSADMQNDTLQLVKNILSNGKAGLIDLDLNQKMQIMGGSADMLALKEYTAFIIDGVPNEGQSLDDVKTLLLGEVKKLKDGDFDESLIKAIVNNMKLRFNRSIEDNDGRVDMMVKAYINGQSWSDKIGQIDRIGRLTKADVQKFAQQHLTDGYVCVKKNMGEDTSIKKIEKPAITPIPSNRDMHSKYLDDIVASEVEPIKPVFVDYKRDLTFGKAGRLPMIYKQNTENDLFNLVFLYEFGNEADNRYDIASAYIDLLGTDKLTNEEIQKKFYSLACSYDVSVGEEQITISLSGLNENMAEALQFLESLLKNAKVDADAYNMFVDQIAKAREDNKKEQKPCFQALWNYALYGAYNPQTNQMSAEALKQTDPQTLIDLLKNISAYNHEVIYYGPSSEKEVAAIIKKYHKTPKTLAAVPQNKEYKMEVTPQNEVLIAPYDAKNIYLRKYHNENKKWNVDEEAVIDVFNEYFGGGMNTIVFQELREARGLAYNANAFYNTPSKQTDPEYVMEHIITQNDKMADCISVFGEITDNLPQSESAFNLAKQSIEKSIQSRRVTKLRLINSYLAARKLGIDYDVYEKVYATLPSMTLKDIADFEQKTMAKKPWKYVILGNEAELDMDVLNKIGNIKRVSLEEIFGY